MIISIENGNIDAPRNDTRSAIAPPTEGPIIAPAEYNDVNNPEIRAYVSIRSGNPLVEMAKSIKNTLKIYLVISYCLAWRQKIFIPRAYIV